MNCSGCGNEIEPMYAEAEEDAAGDPRKFQGSAALHLRATGGYGEFFDLLRPIDLIFCHACGHKIFALFPHLVEQFRGSHSLRDGTPMIDGMCWGFEQQSDGSLLTVYGDGLTEREVYDDE